MAKSVAANPKMVRSCSAIGCTNRDTKKKREKEIRFYRIPLKPEKRKL